MRTITWSTQSGKAASVSVEMRRQSRHLGTDEWTGEAIKRDEGWAIDVEATVEGMGVVGTSLSRACPLAGYTGTIGSLAVPAAQMEQVEAAIAEIKASDEWRAQEAARAARAAELDEYEASRRRIERAMHGGTC